MAFIVAGISFAITAVSLYASKPAFVCIPGDQTSSGEPECSVGSIIGFSMSVAIIATGIAYIAATQFDLKSGISVTSSAPSSSPSVSIPSAIPSSFAMRFGMGSCGCGI